MYKRTICATNVVADVSYSMQAKNTYYAHDKQNYSRNILQRRT